MRLIPGDPSHHKIFQVAVEQRLSVRDVEGLAKRVQAGGPLPGEKKARQLKPIKSADVHAMESELEKAFGTRVEIRTRKDEKSGRIVIHFYNLTDFDNIRKAPFFNDSISEGLKTSTRLWPDIVMISGVLE